MPTWKIMRGYMRVYESDYETAEEPPKVYWTKAEARRGLLIQETVIPVDVVGPSPKKWRQ